jgi:hypothetical protein
LNGDVSLNGNLVVYGNLRVQQVQNANIINTTVNNYQLIISEDISLNGRLHISKDASFGGNLVLTGTGTTGLVGIGTNAPAYPLDVSGVIRTTGGVVITPTATATTYVPSYLNDNHIHLRGGTRHGLGYGSAYTAFYTGIDGPFLYGYVGGALGCTSNGISDTLRICLTWLNNGNVGIGTTTPAYSLQVNGQLAATSFNATSDYRIKENVQPLDESFTIDNIKPVSFTNKLLNRQDIGMIAHEVQEEYPYLVTGEKDGEDNQTVNYTGFIGLLIHEVKQLKEQIKQMQADIEIMKANQ